MAAPMTDRDRFLAVMEYGSPDRVPNWEAGAWPQTTDRWQAEGLDRHMLHWDWFTGEEHFGMDHREYIPVHFDMLPAFDHETLEETDRYEIFRDGKGQVRRALKEGTSRGGRMSMDTFLSHPVTDLASFRSLAFRYNPAHAARYPAGWRTSMVPRWKQREHVLVLGRNCSTLGFYWRAREWMGTEGELEGGCIAGSDFPVFDCDFGKVGIQICYDMAWDDGWAVLGKKGAEIVVWPSQWPGRISASARAHRHRYYVLTSTWRNNASLTDPTGHLVRDIKEYGVMVEQIDLDYVLLHWQSTLKNGKAFDEKYGGRAGYRYDEAEDSGIFWSNDPSTPIREMVKALGLEPKPEQLVKSQAEQDRIRGGPPSLD